MKIKLAAVSALACLALSGCITTPAPNYGNYGGSTYNNQSNACTNCGTVIRIDEVLQANNPHPATGAVLGGVVGAIAGHEISDHTGGSRGNRNVAAAIGAGAGALAGHQIQQSRSGPSWDIQVRMDDGRVIVVNQRNIDGIHQNGAVQVNGGRVTPR